MGFARACKHLATPAWVVSRVFSQQVLANIERAIAETERTHGGEIRFAVEGNLGAFELWRGVTARDRALEVFAQLGVWDTEANNGVLIYVLWADHDVEIVADRGFNGKVAHEEWAAVCKEMEKRFKAGDAEGAIIEGVREVGALIARHYPAADGNELPDQPVVL
ncbi:MAG TPA: TPM domain-containing protein [Steroidobacteraceae bacterium]